MKNKHNPPTQKSARRKQRRRPSSKDGFRQLADAIAAVSPVSPSEELSHAECEATLEFFVDAEHRGKNAQALYPAVWKHVQSCERCHLSYTLLVEALQERQPIDPEFRSRAPALSLPFLKSSQPADPWRTLVHPHAAGAPPGFRLIVQMPFLLNQLATPVAGPVLRGDLPQSDSRLVLTDAFSLGQDEVDVELRARRSQDGGRVQFTVLLAFSAPPPEPLSVTLAWQDRRMSHPVQGGQATFEEIPLADLENSGELQLEFQSGSETARVAQRGSQS